LIEELNLSFLSRNNGGGSGWFGDRYENIDLVQAEEMVLPMLKFCATLYHHHIKSEGHMVHSAKSRLFGKMIICALVVLRESDVV